MKTIEEAISELQAAPGGPLAEIRRRGVKGVPCSPPLCLVARALAASVGRAVWVSGGGAFCQVASAPDQTPLTKDLLDIVRDFDNRLYPDLEEAGR